MSEENVEIVRRVFAAFNRKAWDEWAELVDPECVYHEGSNYFDTPAVVRGRDAMREALTSFGSAFSEWGLDIEEAIEIGSRVVIVGRWWGVGVESGVRTEIVEVSLWTIKDGCVIEGRVYATRAEAVEAAAPSAP